MVVQAINKALSKRDSMKDVLASNIESVLTEVDGISMKEIDSRLEELQKELLKVANAKGNYPNNSGTGVGGLIAIIGIIMFVICFLRNYEIKLK